MVKLTLATALLASVARLVAAQDEGAETPPCGQTCIMNMVNTPNFGCEAGAMDCLCPNVDFFNGIVDCAKSACNDGTVIAEDAAAAASNSAVAMCATATAGADTPSATESAAGTTDRPSQEQAPQATETESATSDDAAVGAAPTDDAEDASDENQDQDEEDSDEDNDDGSSSKGDTSESKTKDDDSEDESASAGLSVGAKAGIGAAAGVVAVSLVSVAVFFIMRRRREARPAARFPRYTISGPMPGGGRDYGAEAGTGAKGGMSELDFSARRYEDMVPRVQPTSNI